MSKHLKPRPFLKWAGGKTQLVKQLLLRTPPQFNNYFEPFVGGGALFFALFREGKIKKAHLADLNSELIDTYRTIRDDVEALIGRLSEYKHDKEVFYEVRALDPNEMALVERAARMIYLNKTCYNGLYRVNLKGKFNVPFGSYKSPKICDTENLRAVSQALSNVEIECTPFEHSLNKAKKGDFVYFDPPYEPISKTSNFTSYQPGGFDKQGQHQLQQICHRLTKQNTWFMLSNSSAKLIHELYDDESFVPHPVKAKRAINSNAKKRGKLTELIVTNYETGLVEA